jgi:hypothetical protein
LCYKFNQQITKEKEKRMRKILGLTAVLILFCDSRSFGVSCPPVAGDNTKNIRDCVAKASISDKLVILSGQYPISDQILVASGVKLQGSGTFWGSEIDVNFGQDYPNTDGDHAAVVLQENSAVDGLTFFYPAQTKGKRLIEFPPSISVKGSFCRVINSFFPNSYVGIDAKYPHGKLNMENLEFGMYFRGIRIDECYDIDKFSIIHANPGMWATWVDDSEVIGWMMDNSATIEAQRIDWLWVSQMFAFGTKYGILLTSSSHGATGEAQILQSGCDACRYGIYSDVESGGRPWLITVSNWSGTAFNPVVKISDGVSIYLANIEGVNISNANFWGVRNEAIFLNNCSTVALSGNNFITNGWNTADNNSSAIRLVNCKRGNIIGNNGSSSRESSLGIILENSHDITLIANRFEIQSPAIKILSFSSGIIALANGGCVQDLTNDPTNKLDAPCYAQPQNTPTPTPTPTATIAPTCTPTPTPRRTPRKGDGAD